MINLVSCGTQNKALFFATAYKSALIEKRERERERERERKREKEK